RHSAGTRLGGLVGGRPVRLVGGPGATGAPPSGASPPRAGGSSWATPAVPAAAGGVLQAHGLGHAARRQPPRRPGRPRGALAQFVAHSPPVRGRSPAAAGRLFGLVMNAGGRW